ncbi:MAG: UDP-N-acetylmuramoyl-tripeptide--D-alanyl-D-alanine ligase [Armatimonadetes bacterium]|nr:UDP-N-acetylmuramoyl-tripeptide--D-alanyl-D-alanine ligase [Armatimonadota bacterium]
MPISVDDFARRCGGVPHGFSSGAKIEGFAFDSRDAKPGDLFLAIKGERVDGHDYCQGAMAGGAVGALVERSVDCPHILVADLVDALAKFARHARRGFSGPVIAVTGSVGKTTTKEFIAAAMSVSGSVLKNEGNRNSEYSSPLVWAELSPEHKSVVIEMGMRGAGQIAHLCSFTSPTVGVVTNIGSAHIEMVGSRAAIASAKSELLQALPTDSHAVLPQDDEFLPVLREASGCEVITFGFSPEADCRITGYRALDLHRCAVRGRLHSDSFEVELPTVGKHQALNAAAAIAAAGAAGVSVSDAVAGLTGVDLPPMRMEMVERDGAFVLLDTYNASPDSTVAAIQVVCEVPCTGRRLAVLGEMLELGDFTEAGHRLVGKAVAEADLDGVLLTGGATDYIRDEATKRGYPANRIQSLSSLDLAEVARYLQTVNPGDLVLIKGSRALELERALTEAGV